MNPETKLVLDALSKRFDDLESRWENTFTEAAEKLEKSFGEAEE
jgi:tetrahydromethanopterin S-methyltransferase subunit G